MNRMHGFAPYRRQAAPKRNMGAEKKPVAVEGLPIQLLSDYDFEVLCGQREGESWLLETNKGSYKVWEYIGSTSRLETALKWQETLGERGCRGVLKPIINKKGLKYCKLGERNFYLIPWPELREFDGKDAVQLTSAVRELGALHQLNKDISANGEAVYEKSLASILQEKLADLLTYRRHLKEKGARTDFERVYAENFDHIYDQGQTALQNMVVLGYDTVRQGNSFFLVNSFAPQNMAKSDKGVVFLRLEKWDRGPQEMDLALLLASYLPLFNWEEGLFRKLIGVYSESGELSLSGREFLLSYLRFPGRLWFYAYRYFSEKGKNEELFPRLKSYIFECYKRDMCLDAFGHDEEGRENDTKEKGS